MRISSSIALLVSRIVLGIILIGHGWQKFSKWGIAGTADSFYAMGVPAAGLAAVVAAVIVLVAVGAGQISLDRIFFGKRAARG